MTASRIERAVTLSIGAGLALLIACGAGDDATSGADSGKDGGASTGSSSGGSSGTFGDGGFTPPATGVVLVHSAGFRPFRVCFSGYSTIPPQPDRKVMPESNSVGVDVGGAVRLPAMSRAPGTVYVIPQNKAAHTPGDPEDINCGAFIASRSPNEDYLVAGKIDRPLGMNGVEAIVITGCGTGPQLSNLPVVPEDCPGYADGGATYGTLHAEVVPLATTTTTTPELLPVEIFNASHLLLAHTPPGAALDVTYGDFDAAAGAPLAQKVLVDAGLYQPNESVLLAVDQTQIETFGTHGFRIAYRVGGGASDPDGGLFSIDQSLAQVQELSQPLSTPTTYFTGETNFALVLLGDPRVRPTYPDGGANPAYDARRAVHVLAVPVRSEQDAGVLGNEPLPETDDGGSDAGAPK